MCSCTWPHVYPGDRLKFLQEDTTYRGGRWPRQAITLAWSSLLATKRFPPRGHLQRMNVLFIFRYISPKNRHRRDSTPWQSNCLFCVQTKPQRSLRRSFRCSSGILVPFIALVVASLSMPAVDSMPLVSRRLLPAFLHSARRSPCLISWSHQLSGPSSSLKWWRPSLAKSVGASRHRLLRFVPHHCSQRTYQPESEATRRWMTTKCEFEKKRQ